MSNYDEWLDDEGKSRPHVHLPDADGYVVEEDGSTTFRCQVCGQVCEVNGEED